MSVFSRMIATGFPEGASSESGGMGIERSLFAMQPAEQEEARGKIYNDMGRREESAPEPVEEAPKAEKRREEPVVTAQPQKRDEMVAKTVVPPSAQGKTEDEDEAWGAIPSFLRRHKK